MQEPTYTVKRFPELNRVEVVFATPEDFRRVFATGLSPHYGNYLRRVYSALVGLVPPIDTVVIAPTQSDAVEQRFVGQAQHPELNGYPLSAEHLPTIAAKDGKPIARQLALELTQDSGHA